MKNKDTEGSKKRTLKERIRTTLELEDVICKGDMLELRGRENLLVRGCRKILLYTDEEIRLLLCEYVLVIKGRRLYCASYYAGAVCIDGIISSLEIEDKERAKK